MSLKQQDGMAWQLKLACLDIDGWSRSMQNVRNSRVLAKGRAQGLLWLAVVHQWRPHHGIERGGLFAGRKGKCHLPRQGPGLSDHGLSSSPGHSNSSSTSTSTSKQASKPCQHDLRIKYGWTFNIENRKIKTPRSDMLDLLPSHDLLGETSCETTGLNLKLT